MRDNIQRRFHGGRCLVLFIDSRFLTRLAAQGGLNTITPRGWERHRLAAGFYKPSVRVQLPARPPLF